MGNKPIKKYSWINAWAILLVASSGFWLLLPLSSFHVYKDIFQYLSKEAILFRYILSVSARIIGLVSGVGILCRKDIFRKAGVFLCWTTVISIYWKHPQVLFDKAVRQAMPILNSLQYNISRMGLEVAQFAIISRLILSFFELCFACFFIFYFTRSGVKAEFSQ